MHINVKPLLLLALICCLGVSLAFAGEIQKGATMQVKANSIWFEDAAKLTRLQRLKNSGDSTALAAYQTEVLSNRDAWQFTNQLTVRILSYQPRKSRVRVEMQTAGRLLGSTWLLDADALAQ